MLIGYTEFIGKHPKESKENRHYQDEPNPDWLNYGYSYNEDFLKLDIDDTDHKTGEIIEPVKGQPRSEAIKKILDDLSVKYNGVATEHGKHFFFRRPQGLEGKNLSNWYCPLGIKAEWLFPQSDNHEPLVINGVKREFFKGSINNNDVDVLPAFLMPLQKGIHSVKYDLDFPEGDRTQKLGGYFLSLARSKQYSAEEAEQIIRLMNKYVFDNPIPEETLNAEILNASTLAKGKEIENDAKVSASTVAKEIAREYVLITVNGIIYGYYNGVYKPFDESRITAYLTNTYPKQNGRFETEVLRHIRGTTRKDVPEDDGTINVKNGMLKFHDGKFELLPHDPEYISFKMFNAAYDPSASSPLLEKTLGEWFNGDAETIELFGQMMGYLLMNHARYQKAFFFIGKPGTGKSTLIALIGEFCGKENVSAVKFSDMGTRFGLSPLVNKTVNICAEVKTKSVSASDMFKSLTSGEDTVKIEIKYKPPFDIVYTGKLIFGMNSYPDFSDDFNGISRRVIVFQLNKAFKATDANYDPHILSKLKTEEALSTLLNIALSGYKSLAREGRFIESKESVRALDEFNRENDNITRWIEENNYDREHFLREPIKNGYRGLYPDYQSFCINIGEAAKAQSNFSRDIKARFDFSDIYKKMINGERLRFFKE